MATNPNVLRKTIESRLFWATAFLFPLFIFIGFSRSYYLGYFYDAPAFKELIVHTHGIVMTAWVLFFSLQIALIRTKNVKIHMTLGLFGIALAALVVISGLITLYNGVFIKGGEVDGMDPRAFAIIPFTSLMVFVILFAAAIFYRKKPLEHKSLMFLTAINFLPFGFSRMAFIPEAIIIPWAFGVPFLLATAAFIWIWIKYKKLSVPFALGLLLLYVSVPVRLVLMESPVWLNAVDLIAP